MGHYEQIEKDSLQYMHITLVSLLPHICCRNRNSSFKLQSTVDLCLGIIIYYLFEDKVTKYFAYFMRIGQLPVPGIEFLIC